MPKTVKQHIVHTLLEIESGTAKEIALEIQRTKQTRYHTIYKLLQKLCDQKVLLKNGETYTPNPDWLAEKKEFFQKLNSYEQRSLDLSQNAFQFNSVFDYMDFLKGVEKAFLTRNSTIPVYKIMTHAHHFFLDPTYNMMFLKKLRKNKTPITIICYGNSAVDHWIKSNFTKMGAKVILGQGLASMMVFHIYDTVALEVLYSHEFRDVLRQTFGTCKTLDDIDLAELHNKLEEVSYRIHVRAITDSAYISDLRMRANRVAKITK